MLGKIAFHAFICISKASKPYSLEGIIIELILNPDFQLNFINSVRYF